MSSCICNHNFRKFMEAMVRMSTKIDRRYLKRCWESFWKWNRKCLKLSPSIRIWNLFVWIFCIEMNKVFFKFSINQWNKLLLTKGSNFSFSRKQSCLDWIEIIRTQWLMYTCLVITDLFIFFIDAFTFELCFTWRCSHPCPSVGRLSVLSLYFPKSAH